MFTQIYNIVWIYAFYRILKVILNFLYLIYRHYIRKPHDIQKRYGKNSWVIITGATDGIGKGFAIEFAKLDFNILLVSRTEEKLKTVCEEIKSINPNIKTDYIVFDFSSKKTLSDYKESFECLTNKKYDVSILINNIGYAQTKRFSKRRINKYQLNRDI